MSLPAIVLVGRPNVGKSTLYNRLTRSRDALVADLPGLTRDRRFGEGRVGPRPYWVVDTGGFEPLVKDGILRQMAKQTELAVDEADAIVFVVDARQGLTPHDEAIARWLRRQTAPVFLAVNKSEGDAARATAEFFALGLTQPWAISASHGDGVRPLIEHILSSLDADAATDVEPMASDDDGPSERRVGIAIVGRPNVGKSTLINALLGEERVIAFDQPGTTRDAIAIDFRWHDRDYTLVDTAGLRRRGKVFETVEKFSAIKTMQAIRDAEVAVLMLDATADIADQDAHIADLIVDQGRAIVIAVNKWECLDGYAREQTKQALTRKLRFIDHAPRHFISAKSGAGLQAVMRSVNVAYAAATKKLSTPQLTRVLQEAVARQTPPRHGQYRPKPRYAHQGGQNPPIIVIHGTGVQHLTPSYLRYLEGVFRTAFDLTGTPLRLQLVGRDNPYAEREAS